MTRFNVLPWWRSIDNLCLTLILQVDCCVWPPAQYINFHFIPARFRSIYVSSITLCWNTFLSYMKHRVHTFSLNIETAPPSSLKKILDNLCDYANEFASFAGYDSRVKLNRLADSFTVYGENCEWSMLLARSLFKILCYVIIWVLMHFFIKYFEIWCNY